MNCAIYPGILTPKALECLSDVRILAIESSHNEHMLLTVLIRTCSNSQSTGASGHLSNEYTAQKAFAAVGPEIRVAWLAYTSLTK